MDAWPWLQRWKTIIGKLRVVEDAADEQNVLQALSAPRTATVLGFVNAHAMNLVAANPD